MSDSDHSAQDDRNSATTINQDFPSSFFLDPDHFQPLAHGFLKAARVSQIQQDFRSTATEPEAVLENYISTVHNWFPILSIKRLRQDLKSYDRRDNDDLQVLLICMRLISASTPAAVSTRQRSAEHDYLLARQYCLFAESGGFITLRLMQSLLLIAVYEYGHAIYPAAYLTIGRAVRLGTMMGLHLPQHASQLFARAETWTLCEEHRRAWWGIILLDR